MADRFDLETNITNLYNVTEDLDLLLERADVEATDHHPFLGPWSAIAGGDREGVEGGQLDVLEPGKAFGIVNAFLAGRDQCTFQREYLRIHRGGIERAAHPAQCLVVVGVGLGHRVAVLEQDRLDHLALTVLSRPDTVQLIVPPMLRAA